MLNLTWNSKKSKDMFGWLINFVDEENANDDFKERKKERKFNFF